PQAQAEPVDEEAVRLRELGQKSFALAGYESMAATYAALCARPSATIDDHLWHGHARQLARNWPAAVQAYQGVLARLDAEMASTTQRGPAAGVRALASIVPLETQRFLAMAKEQLEQPAAAFDTWVRGRLGKIAYPTSYATTEPAHLKELESKLPPGALKPHHDY